MMIPKDKEKDNFYYFCINHSCGKMSGGAANYCPLADRIRKKNGGTVIGYSCRKEWEAWINENGRT